MSILGTLIGGAIQSHASSKAKDALVTGATDANTAIQGAQGRVQDLYAPGVDLYGRSTDALAQRAGLGSSSLPTQGVGATTAPVEGWSGVDRSDPMSVNASARPINPITATGGAGGGLSAGSYGDLRNPTLNTPDRPVAADSSAASYVESPEYQFLLQRGLDGVASNFSHKGAMYSGAAMKGAAEFAAGLASRDFGDWRDNVQDQNQRGLTQYNLDRTNAENRYDTDVGYLTDRYDRQTQDLTGLANGSSNAVTATGNSFTTAGNAAADAATAIGDARAGNQVRKGNIWSGAASSIDAQLAAAVNPLSAVASQTIRANPNLF